MEKRIKTIIRHIETGREKLSYVDNNLRYIKALKSLNFWLNELYNTIAKNNSVETSKEYEKYFCTLCGFSFYDRVQNSILEYQYGVKPF